jgi:hypothetical protein
LPEKGIASVSFECRKSMTTPKAGGLKQVCL